MKNLVTVFSLLTCLALFTSACAPQTASAQVVKSEKPRETDLQINPEDISLLAQDNTAFALDLYHLLNRQEGNAFYSPYSISTALAMTHAGAKGETARQMAQTLHFSLPAERLNPAFNALALELAARPQQADETVKTPFELSIANALWGQKDYKFLPEFLDILAQYYGAGMQLVDFSANPEAARETINDWVSEQTKERIKNLLQPGAVDTFTRLALTNAIYFKAGWLRPFEKDATRSKPFHLLDGSAVNVPTMHMEERFRYMILEDARALQLPYESGGVSMLLILPDEGKFQAVEDKLDKSLLTQIQDGEQTGPVDLELPKFTFESQFNLNQALTELGMPDAFDSNQADFSGMTGARDLFIGSVIHKAFIAVDENGTEAAAATAVLMVETSMPVPEEPVEFHFDRPFIFMIRDNQTGSILFIGRVLNPSA
ncbi:MAG: serpin family protein [Anaerolineaceae bacterium]|nr:serpin family protein [Anaerolineaceae bacterium]